MKTNPLIKILASSALALTSMASVTLVHATNAQAATTACDSSLLAKATSKVNITFEESMAGGAIGGTGNKGKLAALIASYNASQNKVHVTDVNDTGGYADTWTKYVASLGGSGSTPNVVMLAQEDTQAASDTQSIVPISTCLKADKKASVKTFVTKAINAYTIGSTQVGMPFSVSTPVMYYNKQAFTKSGIKSPPTTMAELINDQKLLQNHGYKYGVAIKKDPWITTTWMGLADLPVLNNGNGHSGRATAATFNNATSQGYWNAIQTIIKNGGLASSATGNINTAYANIFAISSDDAGITFDTTAALGSIQDALPVFRNVTLGVAPLPTLTGKSVGSTPPGGNGLFIPKANSNLETAAAWDFIKYLTSAATIAKWSTGTGYIPIRTDSAAAWKKALTATQFGWYNVAYTAFSKGKSDNATAGSVVGAYADIQGDLVTALNGLTQSPWPSASSLLATAQNAATEHILSYNSRL